MQNVSLLRCQRAAAHCVAAYRSRSPRRRSPRHRSPRRSSPKAHAVKPPPAHRTAAHIAAARGGTAANKGHAPKPAAPQPTTQPTAGLQPGSPCTERWWPDLLVWAEWRHELESCAAFARRTRRPTTAGTASAAPAATARLAHVEPRPSSRLPRVLRRGRRRRASGKSQSGDFSYRAARPSAPLPPAHTAPGAMRDCPYCLVAPA